MTFDKNVELDAALVRAAMRGGFEAVCHAAMTLGLEGGPDHVIKRAAWMKSDPEYMAQVVAAVAGESNEEYGS